MPKHTLDDWAVSAMVSLETLEYEFMHASATPEQLARAILRNVKGVHKKKHEAGLQRILDGYAKLGAALDLLTKNKEPDGGQ
jgi:hypothetical protein